MSQKPKKEIYKFTKKGIFSYVKSPVLNYTFECWKDQDIYWFQTKHAKIVTYKNSIHVNDFPKHRYDAHVFLYNLLGVFSENAQQNIRVSFLARLADGIHNLLEHVLKLNGFEIIDPDPTQWTSEPTTRDKTNLDRGFRVYKQSGKFNPVTHQYEYPEDATHNPEYKGYDTMPDKELEKKVKEKLNEYFWHLINTDESFIEKALLHGLSK